MASLFQHPSPGDSVLAVAGETLLFTLEVPDGGQGAAYLRTNLNCASIRRGEVIANTEEGRPFSAADWHDIEMKREGASSTYSIRIPLAEPGFFYAKAFFLPPGSSSPVWPDGGNTGIKVVSPFSASGNSVYTAFVRQFRSPSAASAGDADESVLRALENGGYAVIPPSGTFREVVRRLDHIIGDLGFSIIQLLPIHPVPTTYARMGRFGSPFASLDFFDVDPAYAEFDGRTTPLEQFCELSDAVHARGGRIFLDIPANHTGWASAFQTTHPEWFRRRRDGAFKSPGAWGVTWEDLVELDYSHPDLRAAMASVFLFWCAKGVDGFRCDAGYMIPSATWEYITSKVREVFPDTVFMLEGLGGKQETTDSLLREANLDWAYSELFQYENREAVTWYLSGAIPRSESFGPLVTFAETHDNNRLAARGPRFASMRTALSALLSQQGAYGITAGVEWFCREKIDVHGAPSLNWGASENQTGLISALNRLLSVHPAFGTGVKVKLVHTCLSDSVAATRSYSACGREEKILVLANLDCGGPSRVEWRTADFDAFSCRDLLSGAGVEIARNQNGRSFVDLAPGCVMALAPDTVCAEDRPPSGRDILPAAGKSRLVRNYAAIAALHSLSALERFETLYGGDPDAAGAAFAADPVAFCAVDGGVPRCTLWQNPADSRRTVMLPPGFLLCLRSATPFRALLLDGGEAFSFANGVCLADGTYAALVKVPQVDSAREAVLEFTSFDGKTARRTSSPLLLLPAAEKASFSPLLQGPRVRGGSDCAVLANRRGAMAQVRAAFGEIRSQYDAFLAVNRGRNFPDNRMVFFTRCRAWLTNTGYSYALDSKSLESFYAAPCPGDAPGSQTGFCEWAFRTPAGMGLEARIIMRLAIAGDSNKAELEIARERASSDKSIADDMPVTVILRPDIEARDFHCKTVAGGGDETLFRKAVQADADGFRFVTDRMAPCRMSLSGGKFHEDHSWTYSVPHEVESGRGLGPCGDLFSPGWFEVELRGGEVKRLTAATVEDFASSSPLLPPVFQDRSRGRVSLDAWFAANPISLFIADRESLKTVIAGFPWFLDWGRDTLIVLRGMLAAGMKDEVVAVLRKFGRFEEHGTLPNIILGENAGNRDTSDAPLWYIVACGDVIDVMGAEKTASLSCGGRNVRDVVASIVAGYIDGTPNGIKVDLESGLVFSPAHFTWMDTNYPAGTPRRGYPVEIQALWIKALSVLREKFLISKFAGIEAKARESLYTLYAMEDGWLADSLRAEEGTPAKAAVREDALRPNQLLAVSLGVVPEGSDMAKAIVRACEKLIIPGGIRSLADGPVCVPQPVSGAGGLLNDPFNPYWGHYEGDEDTRRKPAYHNGTAWGWQFPVYCEAYAAAYGRASAGTALSLLSSVATLLESGCIGSLPEIFDGDSPHTQRGCLAQAWSVSEALRVWKKLHAEESVGRVRRASR